MNANSSPHSSPPLLTSGEAEAIILVKAAPQPGKKHGETVCTAGLTRDGQWVRLFPITFQRLEQAQKYDRWDIVSYRWKTPNNDFRPESQRVEQQSLAITGNYPKADRYGLLQKAIVTSLSAEREAGRSLALIKPTIKSFSYTKKPADELAKELADRESMLKQADLFGEQLVPYPPCPYKFSYKYSIPDGEREGTCQDWEVQATFYKWCKRYGSEKEALGHIQEMWGHTIPKRGLLFAMGTHSDPAKQNTWLINGIIQMGEYGQLTLDL